VRYMKGPFMKVRHSSSVSTGSSYILLHPSTQNNGFTKGHGIKPQSMPMQTLSRIIQWTRYFGTVLADLACDNRSTPILCPFHLDMSRSII
jgi:hypothetical protein